MSTIVNLSYKAKRSLANSMFYKISPDFSPSKLRLPALYMKQNNRTKSQLHSYKKNNKETLTIINNSDYSINQDIQLCEEIVSPSPNPRLKIQYFQRPQENIDNLNKINGLKQKRYIKLKSLYPKPKFKLNILLQDNHDKQFDTMGFESADTQQDDKSLEEYLQRL